MILEKNHYNLAILRHSETKVRVKGKKIDGTKFVYTRVLEGGAIYVLQCGNSCDEKAWWSASGAGGVSVEGA